MNLGKLLLGVKNEISTTNSDFSGIRFSRQS
jgi:hypothetical protein